MNTNENSSRKKKSEIEINRYKFPKKYGVNVNTKDIKRIAYLHM
jgi:hypothetical protein